MGERAVSTAQPDEFRGPSGTAPVVLRIEEAAIVDIHRRTSLQRENVVPLPTADHVVNHLGGIVHPHASPAPGQLIERRTDETVADVVVRIAPVVGQVRVAGVVHDYSRVAAVRAEGAGHVIHRVRPGIGRCELQAVRHAMVQAGLQAAVVSTSDISILGNVADRREPWRSTQSWTVGIEGGGQMAHLGPNVA